MPDPVSSGEKKEGLQRRTGDGVPLIGGWAGGDRDRAVPSRPVPSRPVPSRPVPSRAIPVLTPGPEGNPANPTHPTSSISRLPGFPASRLPTPRRTGAGCGPRRAQGRAPSRRRGLRRGKMSSMLERKVEQVLALETDSPAMLEALDAVSNFYEVGKDGLGAADSGGGDDGGAKLSLAGQSGSARKTLRSELSKQNYLLACQFLQGLDRLRERVEEAHDALATLEEKNRSIAERIASAGGSMAQFLERAESLEQQNDELNAQADRVESFLTHYQLNSEEIKALHEDPIERAAGEPFFGALERLDEIRAETKQLVGSRHQGTGFELLDALSAHQERAFARLYEWVQHQVGQLGDEGAEADPVLQRAVRTLHQNPTFYAHCQEMIVSVRRMTLIKHFVSALSATDDGDVARKVRPLDLHANDPVRYASDMMAWVHQTVVTERELVRSLFDQERGEGGGGGGGAGESKGASGAEEPEEPAEPAETAMSHRDVLKEVLEGLGEPLQMRVGQVLDGARGNIVHAFQLSGLLTFYNATLRELLSETSALCAAVSSCRTEIYGAFLNLLEEHGARVRRALEGSLAGLGGLQGGEADVAGLAVGGAFDAELQPSASLRDAFHTLARILEASRSALTPPNEPEADREPFLEAFLRPLLDVADGTLRGAVSCDAAIFLMNGAFEAKAVLAPYEEDGAGEGAFASETPPAKRWASEMQARIDGLREVLASLHSKKVLESTSLASLLSARDAAVAQGGRLAEHPALSAASVEAVLKTFNNALFTLFVPDFERIRDPDEKAKVREDTMGAVAAAYEDVWNTLRDPSNGFAASDALVHTPEQVRMLLDI